MLAKVSRCCSCHHAVFFPTQLVAVTWDPKKWTPGSFFRVFKASSGYSSRLEQTDRKSLAQSEAEIAIPNRLLCPTTRSVWHPSARSSRILCRPTVPGTSVYSFSGIRILSKVLRRAQRVPKNIPLCSLGTTYSSLVLQELPAFSKSNCQSPYDRPLSSS